jgi:hypothetical protein
MSCVSATPNSARECKGRPKYKMTLWITLMNLLCTLGEVTNDSFTYHAKRIKSLLLFRIRGLSMVSSSQSRLRRMNNFERPHHVIILMVEDVTMKYITWAQCGIKREVTTIRCLKVNTVASHKVGWHYCCVLEPSLIYFRWNWGSSKTRAGLWKVHCNIAAPIQVPGHLHILLQLVGTQPHCTLLFSSNASPTQGFFFLILWYIRFGVFHNFKISKIRQICGRKKIPNFCHNVIRAFQQHVLHQDLTTEKLQGIHSVLRRHLLNFQAYRPIFLFSQILKWLRPSVEGITIWNSVLAHPLHRLVIASTKGPILNLKT